MGKLMLWHQCNYCLRFWLLDYYIFARALCPVCFRGQLLAQIIRKAMQHSGPILAANNSLAAIACQACGYAHLDPLPDKEEVDDLYFSDKFYQVNGKAWFEKEAEEHSKKWWHSLYKYQTGLLDSRYILDVGSGAGWYIDWCLKSGEALA